ncbi:TetR/AcrR family transcriptional regulator [Shewanella sp. CG12_big_fil_rev_8_21_14_0_65_47_15]|uniref:TetR/AcrR family transcriptional regulator n=1 Tax=Shewanella sp. CG12_big_fil_rev_8_21_14_0_65_47_15 TaxID=1975537 RepID=UPI000CADC340|nr:TetR/AcrR family transcriptional regulator [Shewanella sp. CG12_big_fil_rev_8_21_14_0_65_47_15]PIW60657.1 MAG: TetR family transcriptional regulator [Shewanella sp. CG12_big_fil_rev_8_21_14_0_65_47_15]
MKPFKFERDKVIDAAKLLFWQKGFHGTSMRDLQQAVDLRPGSIYASFGDKSQLYSAALMRYADEGYQALQQCFEETGDAEKSLAQFLHLAVNRGVDEPSHVCMLVKTIAELGDEEHSLAILAKQQLARMENAFFELFLHLQQQQGKLLDQEPRLMAKEFQALVIGLKTYAQTGQSQETMQLMSEHALKYFFTR